MTRFFNMIPGDDTCCILLYGDIGDGVDDKVKSVDIARELLEAEGKYKTIDGRINSMGGDVYAGIAIFNAFRNSEADINLYIDGVAASIASAVAACGKPVHMSKYARLMIHSVAGGCYGTKYELLNTVKEIEALEDTLCTMYAARCGKTEEEIREMFFDGKDHWFTAGEALELGLIDSIYDAEPIPEAETPEQIYTHFQNKYKTPILENMFNNLKTTRPTFKNFATEEEAMAYIAELEEKAAKVDGLETEITELKNKLTGFETKAQADEEKEIDELVEEAFEEGRITDPERPFYKNLMRSDRANTEAALKARPAKRVIMKNLGKPSGDTVGAWDRRQEEIKNNLKK